MPTVNPQVFKAYDVRGIYPTEVTADLFHQLGRAFVAYLGPGRYAVSRDMRTSSPELASAFIEGVRLQGGDVVDYGLMGTDLMYYAVAADDLDGGAQVTASHNPGEYNGCKMVKREAFPLSGEAGIKEMKEMILAGAIPEPSGARGSLEQRNVLERYTEHVMGFIDAQIDQALQRRPRRRQRHCRPGRASAVRSAAVPDQPSVLRGGRDLPQSRGQPAHRGEPP